MLYLNMQESIDEQKNLEKLAQTAFPELVQDGAFDLFKEIFNTFNKATDGWKSGPGAPYETSLTTRAPPNWQFAPDILTEVFSQYRRRRSPSNASLPIQDCYRNR